MNRTLKSNASVVVALTMALLLAACGSATNTSSTSDTNGPSSAGSSSASSSSTSSSSTTDPIPEPIDENTTDMMYTEHKAGEQLDVVIYDGRAVLVPSGEALDCGFETDTKTGKEVEDGRFYHVVADVDYLNGGIAGYYNYPDIQSVISVEEISPANLEIPSINEKSYGLLRLDGYAEGDYLLNETGGKAVLSDGKWIYKYDKSVKGDDGTLLLLKDGTDQSTVDEGVANGVVCCEDYFVVPSTN